MALEMQEWVWSNSFQVQSCLPLSNSLYCIFTKLFVFVCTPIASLANSLAPIFNTVESTVQELPATSQTRYHCEVSGVPTPTIEWTARSAQSNQQESVTDNTAGISIITFPPEGIEASSILTINDGASFTMPNCIAENAVDRLRLRADEFLVISAPGPGNGML